MVTCERQMGSMVEPISDRSSMLPLRSMPVVLRYQLVGIASATPITIARPVCTSDSR